MGATRSGDISPGSSSSTLPPMRVMAAGAMRLILIPCFVPATVRLRVIPISPAFAVAYGRLFGRPNMPVDVVMTMRP